MCMRRTLGFRKQIDFDTSMKLPRSDSCVIEFIIPRPFFWIILLFKLSNFYLKFIKKYVVFTLPCIHQSPSKQYNKPLCRCFYTSPLPPLSSQYINRCDRCCLQDRVVIYNNHRLGCSFNAVCV